MPATTCSNAWFVCLGQPYVPVHATIERDLVWTADWTSTPSLVQHKQPEPDNNQHVALGPALKPPTLHTTPNASAKPHHQHKHTHPLAVAHALLNTVGTSMGMSAGAVHPTSYTSYGWMTIHGQKVLPLASGVVLGIACTQQHGRGVVGVCQHACGQHSSCARLYCISCYNACL